VRWLGPPNSGRGSSPYVPKVPSVVFSINKCSSTAKLTFPTNEY
jgi:hypothetical protein